jgi:large subunit ribosomal protein LP0
MAPKNTAKLAKKNSFLEKLKTLLKDYPKILIIEANHVGSRQMQQIRIALRGTAEVLMGKNTMVRKALAQFTEENEGADVEALLKCVRGNIGFIFCKGDVDAVRKVIDANKVPAAAKAGVIAPLNVTIPAGPTGLDPTQTSFFQALNIATKVVKAQIEIVSDVHLIKAGQKVQLSEQVLLAKLNVKPFQYGMKILSVYEDGEVFDAGVLDITNDFLISRLLAGIRNVAAFSREAGLPNEASAPHAIVNAFKNCAAVCAEIEYSFPEIAALKEFLKDPSKFASAVAAPAASGASPKAGAKAAAPAPVEEEEEEGAAFDLFD